LSRPGHEAERTCLGCRRVRPQPELIRIARGPEGAACFDIEGRMPGRGAWVCPAPSCLDALSPGSLGHALRAPVVLPPARNRRGMLSDSLRRRAGNLLTIARKTRGLTCGPTGCRLRLAEGRARLLLLAEDLAEDAAVSWRARAGDVPTGTAPPAVELGSLMGSGPVSVAAVTVEGLAAGIRRALDQWRTFRTDSCDNEKLIITGKKRAAQVAPPREEAGGR